jgi:nitroreductase
MTLLEAIKQRHSVRAYTTEPIADNLVKLLNEEIERVNSESGLSVRLITNDDTIFDSRLAHYGKFSNVRNSIILAGPDTPDFKQRCGYYGEHLVLYAQTLGLNTCWVVLTYSRKAAQRLVSDGQRMACVISIGYGQTQGASHKIKSYSDVCTIKDPDENIRRGVEAALLAPTALNAQNFKISLKDNKIRVKPGLGLYTKIDAGIVMYHFELASGIKLEL